MREVFTHGPGELDESDILTGRLLGWGRLVGYSQLFVNLPAGSWMWVDDQFLKTNSIGISHCDGKKGDRVPLWEK